MARTRAVIDTNVLMEGMTKRGSAPGWIVDSWLAGVFAPCVSTSLAFEYEATLSTKLSEAGWSLVKPLFAALLREALYVEIFYTWRPSSPDPGDEHVIDCALNAGALLVTSNEKDFRTAVGQLGLRLASPTDFLQAMLALDETDSPKE